MIYEFQLFISVTLQVIVGSFAFGNLFTFFTDLTAVQTSKYFVFEFGSKFSFQDHSKMK